MLKARQSRRDAEKNINYHDAKIKNLKLNRKIKMFSAPLRLCVSASPK